MRNRLIVITGPTGSGKSDLAMQLAGRYGCDIISADSRQMFREIPVGTAAPSADDLARVSHHFIGNLSLGDYYSAAQYEQDVMRLLPSLWEKSPVQIMCGGSMMYIDAVTRGIDELPTISGKTRRGVLEIYEREGIDTVRAMLLDLDPDAAARVDLNNPRRVIHALEICLESGRPYTALCTGTVKQRDFDIIKLAISLPREVMFDRINRRVDRMVEAGMIEEVGRLYQQRHLNSLNTVGCKEIFAMMDGKMDRDTAIARIGKNTRVYAKKQLTWLKRDPSVIYLDGTRPLLPQALAVIGGQTVGEEND